MSSSSASSSSSSSSSHQPPSLNRGCSSKMSVLFEDISGFWGSLQSLYWSSSSEALISTHPLSCVEEVDTIYCPHCMSIYDLNEVMGNTSTSTSYSSSPSIPDSGTGFSLSKAPNNNANANANAFANSSSRSISSNSSASISHLRCPKVL